MTDSPLPQKNWFDRRLDDAFAGTILFIFKTLYKGRVKGLENLKAVEGKPAVYVANHVSKLDAFLLAATLPRGTAFAMLTQSYEAHQKKWLDRFLLSRMTMFPVDTNNPYSLKDMTNLVKSGTSLMIFPEGRFTSTGTLMQTFDGAGTIATRTGAPIVPIHLEGFQFLPQKQKLVKYFPTRWFPRLSATIMEPQTVELQPGLSGKKQRALTHQQVDDIMHNLPIQALDRDKSLMDALHEAAHNFGRDYPILDDPDPANEGKTYGDVLTGAYALGADLARTTAAKENVGILLPNSVGCAVTFWALQAYGRVPAMLNAKAETANMRSYTETASLKTVITSRKFVEMAKLEDKIAALEAAGQKIVYLEDVKANMSLGTKIKAKLRARNILPRPAEQGKGEDPAVIIFTSGSEGFPKGVVLSSTNLLSNAEQVCSISGFTPADRVFNAMPTFHSFGLNGGMILPMLKGVRSYQFPNPLDAKIIPKVVYRNDATILFGTNTFLSLYARKATNEDFGSSLKHVFAGAEALSQETYDTYVERFGVQIQQGYGMTEAAPVVATNVRGAHKTGTVGQFVPGIETRLEPVPGIEDGHRLYIRGLNVMLGYLKHDNPGVIQKPEDGWHDTGDIVSVDEEGYVKLVGRAKRFAKIGGEMVSLDVVENIARTAAQTPNTEQAIILRQTPDKGDSIVLFTTDPALKREHLTTAAQTTGQSILGLPKPADIRYIAEMPKLPTGKTDYVTLKELDKANPIIANDPTPREEEASDLEDAFETAASPAAVAADGSTARKIQPPQLNP